MTGLLGLCCSALPALLILAGMWRVFEKAGRPGWAAIIPIYNAWVLVEISGKSALWFVLLLIPVVNLVAAILIHIALAERFGKGALYGIGLTFLPFVFFPFLGFGDASLHGGGGDVRI